MKTPLLRIIALNVAVAGLALACSGLAVVKDGRVALGANADQPFVDDLKLRATPGRDGLFGRICISREVVPGWSPFGATCLNDQGLAITHANTPAAGNPHDPDKPQFRHNFPGEDRGGSGGGEAGAGDGPQYTFPPGHETGMHMMLADRSGDAVVVEWVDRQVKVIPREGAALLMTNSLLSKPETAGGQNSRYNRGLRMLPQMKDAGPDSVFSVLREISVGGVVKGREVGTLYSGVWDVTNGELHLVYRRDYDHPRTFKLSDELANGEHSIPLGVFPQAGTVRERLARRERTCRPEKGTVGA